MTEHKPFKDLTDAEKGALLLAHHEGKQIQHRWHPADNWTSGTYPVWLPQCIYRIVPEPLIPDSIDWSHVAPEWKFMARDEDGGVCFYKTRPNRMTEYWETLETNYTSAPVGFASYRRGTVDWKDSLVVRPS